MQQQHWLALILAVTVARPATAQAPTKEDTLARRAVDAALNDEHEVVLGLEIWSTEQPALELYVQSAGTPADRDRLLTGPFWRFVRDGRSSEAMLGLRAHRCPVHRGRAEIDAKLAAMMGTTQDEIRFHDLAGPRAPTRAHPCAWTSASRSTAAFSSAP
ncbi:MAG: hypothetical protein GY711_25430 [bacterium]|nr:hypothetical protein [bacterium]